MDGTSGISQGQKDKDMISHVRVDHIGESGVYRQE
jgi:hypothetical protein